MNLWEMIFGLPGEIIDFIRAKTADALGLTPGEKKPEEFVFDAVAYGLSFPSPSVVKPVLEKLANLTPEEQNFIQIANSALNPLAQAAAFAQFFLEEALQTGIFGLMGAVRLHNLEPARKIYNTLIKVQGYAEYMNDMLCVYNPFFCPIYDEFFKASREALNAFWAQIEERFKTLPGGSVDEERRNLQIWYEDQKNYLGEWYRTELDNLRETFRMEADGRRVQRLADRQALSIEKMQAKADLREQKRINKWSQAEYDQKKIELEQEFDAKEREMAQRHYDEELAKFAEYHKKRQDLLKTYHTKEKELLENYLLQKANIDIKLREVPEIPPYEVPEYVPPETTEEEIEYQRERRLKEEGTREELEKYMTEEELIHLTEKITTQEECENRHFWWWEGGCYHKPMTPDSCRKAGRYWYFGECHKEPPEEYTPPLPEVEPVPSDRWFLRIADYYENGGSFQLKTDPSGKWMLYEPVKGSDLEFAGQTPIWRWIGDTDVKIIRVVGNTMHEPVLVRPPTSVTVPADCNVEILTRFEKDPEV